MFSPVFTSTWNLLYMLQYIKYVCITMPNPNKKLHVLQDSANKASNFTCSPFCVYEVQIRITKYGHYIKDTRETIKTGKEDIFNNTPKDLV